MLSTEWFQGIVFQVLAESDDDGSLREGAVTRSCVQLVFVRTNTKRLTKLTQAMTMQSRTHQSKAGAAG